MTSTTTHLRQRAAELRAEASQLASQADQAERAQRLQRNQAAREARVAALRADPAGPLVVGSVEEQHQELGDGSVRVHEIEVLYEKNRPNPVAQRWPDGEMHWFRNPIYLSKVGIDMLQPDRLFKASGEQRVKVGPIQRLRAFSRRERL